MYRHARKEAGAPGRDRADPDHEIFDPVLGFTDAEAPACAGESYRLRRRSREVRAPALVLTGERDLRTPFERRCRRSARSAARTRVARRAAAH